MAPTTEEAAPEVVHRIRLAGRVLTALAAALGALVLIGGWWLGVEAVRSWPSAVNTMKAATAFCVLLEATALWLLPPDSRRGPRTLLGALLGGVVGLVATLSLTEDVLHVHFGLDELLAGAPGTVMGTAARMAPTTALALMLLGGAAIGLAAHSRRGVWLGQLLAVLAMCCGAIGVAGYLYGVESLYRFAGLVSVAPQTACALVGLALAVLSAQPDRGFVRLMAARSTAGTLIRRLLPVIVLVPVVLGWLRLRGEEAGFYQMRFGLALFVVLNVGCLIVVSWLVAARLHATERARQGDLEALAASERSLAVAQRMAHIGSWEMDAFNPIDRSDATLHGSAELWRLFGLVPGTPRPSRELLLTAVHPDDRERVQVELARAIREHTPFRADHRIRRPDGEERLVAAHAEVTFDEHGAPTRMAGTLQDITEAKRLENALRLSESRLSLIYEAVADPTYLIEIDGAGGQRIVSVNRATERYLGRSRAEIFGLDLAALSPGAGAKRVTDAVARAVAQRSVVEYEVVAQVFGGPRALAVRVAPVLEGDAPIRHVVIVGHDVTIARQVEDAVRASEARLRQIIDLAPVYIYARDADGGFLLANRKTAALFGREPDELVGRTIAELGGAGAFAELSVGDAETAQGASQVFPEQRVTFSDGEERVLYTLKVPYTAADGGPGILAVSLDVTAEKATEERLRLSEARYRLQYEQAPEAIITIDPSVVRLVEVNDRAAELFGRDRRGLLGLDAPALAELLGTDLRENLGRALAGQVPTFESRVRNARGMDVPVEARMVRLPAGEPLVRCSLIDTSERKLAEELRARSVELEQEIRRVQETSRLKSAFLANMSHELRTPLNAIIGFAELLSRGRVPIDAPEHNEFLGDILSSGRHLLSLVNDILDLSKIDAGRIELHPESVQVEEIVREVCSVLGGATHEKQLHLGTEVTIGEVFADPSRLKQILYNYLSNAIKFTPSGGRIMVRVRPDEDGRFRIEVEDTGVGIAARDVERLFVEFQQLDTGSTKRYQGTGLGLALTKRLAEAQGGTVGVTSTPGSGSIFSAVLPRGV